MINWLCITWDIVGIKSFFIFLPLISIFSHSLGAVSWVLVTILSIGTNLTFYFVVLFEIYVVFVCIFFQAHAIFYSFNQFPLIQFPTINVNLEMYDEALRQWVQWFQWVHLYKQCAIKFMCESDGVHNLCDFEPLEIYPFFQISNLIFFSNFYDSFCAK